MAEKRDPDDDEVDPQVLKEPKRTEETPEWEIEDDDENVWMRGLWMLILGILFELGRAILWIAAILQFLWMLFAKEKNEHVAGFGKDLGDWLERIARFQCGTTEDKPFPFAKWGPLD